MRVLFYYLLILNLLYAGWEYMQPSNQAVEVVSLAEGLQTLELLNEVDAEPVVDASAPAEVSEVSVDNDIVALESLSCFTLGPFKDEEIAQQIRESMAEEIEGIKIRTLEELEKHRYWVYIPSLANRKQAKDVARKLKRSKLKDFYVVLSGDTKNSISLGHFKELEYANRRAKKVKDLGFAASVEVIYKKYNMHWIDYRASKDDDEIESLINNYVSEGVSRLNRNCE